MENLEERIKLVKDIKKFAVKKLGICENGSFENVSGDKHAYVVYASRRDKIEPAMGRAYEIFEKKGDCDILQKELKKRGFDTIQVLWEAWGSEECPITQSILRASKTRLSYLVLHENFHIHCKKKDIKLEPHIEEAVGNVFAYQGSLIYFRDRNPWVIQHIERDFIRDLTYDEFVKRYTDELNKAYEKNPSKARLIFEKAKKEKDQLDSEGAIKSGFKKSALKSALNNAYFLMQQDYCRGRKSVFAALKDVDPRLYITNTDLLQSKLEKIS